MTELKTKISVWLKDWHNRVFLFIFCIALAVRVYYLSVNTAVWWDEADYLSSALHWFFNVPYNYNPQRGVFFPLLLGILFKFGFTENSVKFFAVVLPSSGVVFLTYLLGKQMYNKNVGLISAAFMSVFWTSLFWTARFSNDFLALFFQLLALYCFWRGVVKEHSKIFIFLFGFFLGLGFITRAQSILITFSLLLFLLITQHFSFLKNKHLWASVLFFFIPFIPYVFWLKKYFGSFFAFSTGYSSQISSAAPFGWSIVKYFYLFPAPFIFILFLLGLTTLADIFFGLDFIFKKKQSQETNSDLFWVMNTLLVVGFFIFWLRGAEDRWLVLVAVPVFFFAAKGCMLLYDYTKKVHGHAAILLVVFLVMIGMYFQFHAAKTLIEEKNTSYQQVKDAALWIKANSQTIDTVYSASGPQTSYYSERNVLGFPTIVGAEF